MATHARQQYFADENSLSKERREFSLEDNIKQKIDSVEAGAQVNTIETVKVNGTALTPDANKAVNVLVPDVIDNLYSTSTDDALSAKQGKVLYDYIQNIASRGRFLSNWNCATGLPVTNPTENPYPYKAGDYYSVSNVASGGGTNYRPNGSSYIIGQASTTVETDTVAVSDFYLYDGSNWLLLTNSARQIAIDSSLSTVSTNPVENRVVTNAINGKADASDLNTKTFYLSSTSDLTTAQAALDWYNAGKNAIICYNEEYYIYNSKSSNYIQFYTDNKFKDNSSNSYTTLYQKYVQILFSGNTATSISQGNNPALNCVNVLTTDKNYSAPYTPQYNGSPATKKYVDDKSAYVGSSAPSNSTEGRLWYDTTNDVLKSYDGSSWKEVGGSDIGYVTQAEYNALLPGALTDNKHYFIYSTSGGGWQPGVNTLFYFPFTTDQLDHVGSASIDTTGTQDTLGYNFTSSGEMKVVDAPSTTKFISAWVKYNSYENNVTQFGGTYVGFMIYNFRHSQNASYDKVFQISTGASSYNASTAQNTTTGTRYHMAMGYDGTQAVAYINGQQVWSSTSGHYENGYIRFGYGIDMNVSEYIGESVCWTAQEVSDYFDQTKGDYGIS